MQTLEAIVRDSPEEINQESPLPLDGPAIHQRGMATKGAANGFEATKGAGNLHLH